MTVPLGQRGLVCNPCWRTDLSLASARLAVLEEVGHKMGFMRGTRTRGPKPTRMAEAHPKMRGKCDKIRNCELYMTKQ
jgi:hypothetical protein